MEKSNAYLKEHGLDWAINNLNQSTGLSGIDQGRFLKVFAIEEHLGKNPSEITQLIFESYGHFRIKDVNRLINKLEMESKGRKFPEKIMSEMFFNYLSYENQCLFYLNAVTEKSELENLYAQIYPEFKMKRIFAHDTAFQQAHTKFQDEHLDWIIAFETSNMAEKLQKEFFPLVTEEVVALQKA